MDLDCALQRATEKRRKYPEALSQYLDKTLQHRADAATHKKTDVKRKEISKEEKLDRKIVSEEEDLSGLLGRIRAEEKKTEYIGQAAQTLKKAVEVERRVTTAAASNL